jgi:hypothetical protein
MKLVEVQVHKSVASVLLEDGYKSLPMPNQASKTITIPAKVLLVNEHGKPLVECELTKVVKTKTNEFWELKKPERIIKFSKGKREVVGEKIKIIITWKN